MIAAETALRLTADSGISALVKAETDARKAQFELLVQKNKSLEDRLEKLISNVALLETKHKEEVEALKLDDEQTRQTATELKTAMELADKNLAIQQGKLQTSLETTKAALVAADTAGAAAAAKDLADANAALMAADAKVAATAQKNLDDAKKALAVKRHEAA